MTALKGKKLVHVGNPSLGTILVLHIEKELLSPRVCLLAVACTLQDPVKAQVFKCEDRPAPLLLFASLAQN